MMLATFRLGMGFQQPAEKAAPFQWLAASGETSGVKYVTHSLKPLSIQTRSGPPVEIEQEEVKVDAQTTRMTRRAFMTFVNGERQLMETVVEEIQRMPGDRVHAVRTTSRKDLSNRFSPVEQEIQDMAPSGAEAYQIRKTLLLPGTGSALVEKEQIQQTERRKGDTIVEIDRVLYLPVMNGGWSAAERRISQNTLGKEQTRTEEQVYANDVNNRLALTQQIKVTEWGDSTGRNWQSESYALGLEGKLQLDSRVTILQKQMKEGRQQTTEILEKTSPTAHNEGLKLVRKIVENLKVLSPNETERQLEVLEPDLNGGLQSIHSRQGTEGR
jgi:hypothetical protein